MENEDKPVVPNTEEQGSNWGLYILIIFCLAIFAAMLVTAYIDHN